MCTTVPYWEHLVKGDFVLFDPSVKIVAIQQPWSIVRILNDSDLTVLDQAA